MYQTKAEALDSKRWPPAGTMIKAGSGHAPPKIEWFSRSGPRA